MSRNSTSATGGRGRGWTWDGHDMDDGDGEWEWDIHGSPRTDAASWNPAADGASFRHELHSTPFARASGQASLSLSALCTARSTEEHAARGGIPPAEAQFLLPTGLPGRCRRGRLALFGRPWARWARRGCRLGEAWRAWRAGCNSNTCINPQSGLQVRARASPYVLKNTTRTGSLPGPSRLS